ncbi:hypothetical protein F4780DRAFT_790520 [Xylariomycetidae sp. FL0641]|nr:hypothetical protein F4780DRAFT_790520 [Xylariomycetidae sp. FL0641]
MAIGVGDYRHRNHHEQYAVGFSLGGHMAPEKTWPEEDPRQAQQVQPAITCDQPQAYQHPWPSSYLSKGVLEAYQQKYPSRSGGWRLEDMPQDILDRICQHSDYEDLILGLRRTCSTLYAKVKPLLAPSETQFRQVQVPSSPGATGTNHGCIGMTSADEFVDDNSLCLRAERDFSKHRADKKRPFHMACFICSKVKGPENFAINQPLERTIPDPRAGRPPGAVTTITLRQFCIPCGVAAGLHPPGGAKLVSRAGAAAACWVCRCRRTWPWGRVHVCPHCGANCPFSGGGSGGGRRGRGGR